MSLWRNFFKQALQTEFRILIWICYVYSKKVSGKILREKIIQVSLTFTIFDTITFKPCGTLAFDPSVILFQ